MTQQKQCSVCLEVKPLEAFSVHPRYRLGVTRQCKRCKAAAGRTLYSDRRSKMRAHVLRAELAGSKICAKCKRDLPLTEFSARSDTGNPRGTCENCRRVEERNRKVSPRRRHKNALKALYGISLEEWDAILIQQAGRCAICWEPMRRPMVDHSHHTGQVRGLLCPGCNNHLAAIERPGFVEKARKYLEVQSSNTPVL